MKKIFWFISASFLPSLAMAAGVCGSGTLSTTYNPFTNKLDYICTSSGGGTPSGNTGDIQIKNAGSFYGTDNLFFDTTTFRVGIGTNAPECQLHQKSTLAADLGLILYWNVGAPTGSTPLFGRFRFGAGGLPTDTASFGYRPYSFDSGKNKTGFVWQDSTPNEMMKFDEGNGRLHVGNGNDEGVSNLNVAGNASIGTGLQYSTWTAPTNGLLVQGNATIQGSTLSVNGLDLTYPISDGTNGQVLTTNGSKVLSFTTVSGGGGGVSVYNSTATAGFPFGFTASTFSTTGDVQIGTNVASARLSVFKTTEQLRLLYDSSNYNSFTTASDGGLSIDSVGSGGGKVSVQDTLQINAPLIVNGGATIGGTATQGNRFDIIGSQPTIGVTDTGAGTGYCFFKFTNNGNTAYFGNENSTGGGVFSGSPAYATVVGNGVQQPFTFYTNGIERMRLGGNGAVEFTSSVTVRAQGINASHIDISSTTPTLSSCGTSPAIVGNDMVGKITIGGGVVTSCTVTFAVAWANAPSCSVTAATFITGQSASTTTTALTVTGTATFNGDTVMYQCLGYQ